MGKHYPEEFKINAVKDYLSGARFVDVLRKYNIPKNCLLNWTKQYQETGRCEDRSGKTARVAADHGKLIWRQ